MPPAAPVATSGRFQALDFAFTVTGPEGYVAAVTEAFADLQRRGPEVAASYALSAQHPGVLRRDGDEVFVGTMGPLEALVHDVNRQADRTVRGTVNVHAAVAVTPAGSALLLCGPSGSGKSTLVASLAERGYGYGSDEMAAIDLSTFGVRPYPKPITLKAGSHELLPQLAPAEGSPLAQWGGEEWSVPSSRIRPSAAVDDDVPLAHVVFPTYRPRAAAALEPMSRAEALVAIGRETSRVTSLGDSVLEVLARIVSAGTRHRLVFGDLDAACPQLATIGSGAA
jgi:hypothetical protein